jgi:hypothetical protein
MSACAKCAKPVKPTFRGFTHTNPPFGYREGGGDSLSLSLHADGVGGYPCAKPVKGSGHALKRRSGRPSRRWVLSPAEALACADEIR